MSCYDELGWPVTAAGGPLVPERTEGAPGDPAFVPPGGPGLTGAVLATGIAVDAIEVPYPAGVLAARSVPAGHRLHPGPIAKPQLS